MRRERGIGGGLPEAEGNEADWFSSRPEEGASEWLRCKTPRVRAQILARAYATGTGIGGGLPEAEGNEADWFSSRPEEGASEWLRCKAPRVKPLATKQIDHYHAPSPLMGHNIQHTPVSLIHRISTDADEVADAAVHVFVDDAFHAAHAVSLHGEHGGKYCRADAGGEF